MNEFETVLLDLIGRKKTTVSFMMGMYSIGGKAIPFLV